MSTARLDFFTEHFGSDFLDLRLINSFPQAPRFRNSYGEKAACALVVHDDYEPHNPATFLCRTFLEEPDDHNYQGKFILALRFHKFGTVATVDLISFSDVKSFSEIAYRHLLQDGWLYTEGQYGHNRFQETLYSPFLLANGSFQKTGEKEFAFVGEQGAYGDKLLSFPVAEVAKFVYNACYRSPCITSKCVGKDLFMTVGDFVSEHKLTDNFYPLLADSLLGNQGILDSRNSLAVLLMEASDKAEKEVIEMPQALVLSNQEGLGKHLSKSGPVALICQDF